MEKATIKRKQKKSVVSVPPIILGTLPNDNDITTLAESVITESVNVIDTVNAVDDIEDFTDSTINRKHKDNTFYNYGYNFG